MNSIVLVGRIVEKPEMNETETGKKKTSLVVAVQRNYKNQEGIYETDFIKCVFWNAVAENLCEYCNKGDVVGVKGRLETRKIEDNEKVRYVQEVVAERVTFLSSNKY